jgi:hypothetical protein
LVAALLYAGSGAGLSHSAAAWWWQLVSDHQQRIHVSAPGKRRSVRGVCVHHPTQVDLTVHRGLPATSVARTLLDLASVVSLQRLRRALAEAEYRRLLDLDALRLLMGRGHSGSATLRLALDRHCPGLARTRSVLEERFLALCEAFVIPMPEVNAKVTGLMVDALWRPQRLIVELDGYAAHGSRAAIERDRQRELRLRHAGYQVLRYTWRQITDTPDKVAADLNAALRR